MAQVIVYPHAIGRITENAFLAYFDGEGVWLPKSQVKAEKRELDGHTEYRVKMPKWLADKHGFTAKNFDGSSIHFHQYE
ncbi:hypothetical protein JOC94_004209 [Bacillus thermophilus]|uniref:SpoVT-AbrB domain-containing protein n=1 Tax=Siminovitchia thermophila TaxID=1245522 RepID=A0ABS2RDA5_9BACI|nr:hypothetical protein [Siminovitchia thermophila]MBM7717184.1 hypothetical protein [Siminovitchia thermophila]